MGAGLTQFSGDEDTLNTSYQTQPSQPKSTGTPANTKWADTQDGTPSKVFGCGYPEGKAVPKGAGLTSFKGEESITQ